jgi:hypothetical protein
VKYILVEQSAGSGGTTDLPTPDATGTLSLSGSNGKVVLASTTTAVTGPTASSVLDLVGYGSATSFEGSGAAPGVSSTTSVFRINKGWYAYSNPIPNHNPIPNSNPSVLTKDFTLAIIK